MGSRPSAGVPKGRDESGLPEQPQADDEAALALLVKAENLLAEGKPREALELLDEVLVRQPSLGQAHFTKAEALRALKRGAEADSEYLKAFVTEPFDRLQRKRIMHRLGLVEGPPLPPGSVALFEDNFCLGCRASAEPLEAKAEPDYESRRWGLATLRMTAPPDRSWALNLKLPASLQGDRLAAMVQDAALVFELNAEQAGDSIEIGFIEGPSDTGRPPAQVSLALDPYMSPGDGFQSAMIPLSEFPELGYIRIPRLHPGGDPANCNCGLTTNGTRPMVKGWVPPGAKMYETGVEDRKEALFHWDRVDTLFIRGMPGPGERRSFHLDRLALVSSYDDGAWKAASKAVRVSRSAELLRTGLRLFGDRPLGLAYAFPKPENSLVVDESFPREGKASARVVLEPHHWGGAGFIIPEKDLRPLRAKGYLRFYVRGKNGGESFTPYLHSRSGPAERVLIRGPESAGLVDIDTAWKDVAVPLADFPDGGDIWDESYTRTRPELFHWERLIEASFESPPVVEVENVFYLDEVRFTLDKPVKARKGGG